MLGNSYKTKRINCSVCGHSMDRAAQVDGQARPAPDDFTLCIRCGHVMVFAADLSVREPTVAELKEIACNPIIQRALVAIRQVQKIPTH